MDTCVSSCGSTAELQNLTDQLVPLLYPNLLRLAHQSRWRFSAGSTLQTTALVHETYLRLRNSPAFNDRQHFLRAAAMAMHHILINMARAAVAEKRQGAQALRVQVEAETIPAPMTPQGMLEVHDSLQRLREDNPRLAQVVECRFFAGYSDEETATALGMTDRTVRRDWVKARAWLSRELDPHLDFDIAPTRPGHL